MDEDNKIYGLKYLVNDYEEIQLKPNLLFEKFEYVQHRISDEGLNALKQRVSDAQKQMAKNLEEELFPPYEPGPYDIRDLMKISLRTRIKRKYWAIREKIGFWIAGHDPDDYNEDW